MTTLPLGRSWLCIIGLRTNPFIDFSGDYRFCSQCTLMLTIGSPLISRVISRLLLIVFGSVLREL